MSHYVTIFRLSKIFWIPDRNISYLSQRITTYSAHNFLCLLHYGLLQPAQLLDVLAMLFLSDKKIKLE